MKERYQNLNGIRVYTAIGIVLAHVGIIGQYEILGFVSNRLIASFYHLPVFFMMISAFSMCCGYYERIRNGTIDLNSFYKRRYQRIWPVFALLCTIELLLDRSLPVLYEWFADITLAFGLLPNHRINVLGGGWFVGVVFVFYMLFPFFVFLMENKGRAWIVMAAAAILHILCLEYFFDADHMLSGFFARSNFAYSFVFFAAGGLIYLYREELKTIVQKSWLVNLIAALAVFTAFYLFAGLDILDVIFFGLLLILGVFSNGPVSKALFQNRFTQIVGPVCMEIYLCHVFVFRAIEKIGLAHMTENETVNYILVVAVTIAGAIIMALVLNKIIGIITRKLRREPGISG